MTNNDVNNQIKINGLFGLYRCIAVVFGVILLSTWTVKSASLVNSTKQMLQQNLNKEITGVVKTEEGDPIPGVTVLKVGTNQETTTDVEGRYSLDANEGDKFQFVFEGFKTVTITVSKNDVLNITMIEEQNIALTTTTVTSDNYICTFPNRNPLTQMLLEQTRILDSLNESTKMNTFIDQVVGLEITTENNNSKTETILKNAEALTRNGNYTYIIDGVRVSEETFRSLNQNDVESVDIYKHTDVYNARFGNKENQSKITLEAR